MKIEVGYPDATAEKEILKRFTNGSHKSAVEPVLTPADVIGLQEDSRKVHIDEEIIDYMLQIVNSTRKHPEIELGVSPRGTVALFRSVQAMALVHGRSYAIPDDVKRLVPRVFAHRLLIARSGSKIRTDANSILQRILDEAPFPRKDAHVPEEQTPRRERQSTDVEKLPPIDGTPLSRSGHGALFHRRFAAGNLPATIIWRSFRFCLPRGWESDSFRGLHAAWTGDGCRASRSTSSPAKAESSLRRFLWFSPPR